jgi:hypothetical protein
MKTESARQKFCGSACRKAHHLAKHAGDAPVDEDGNIRVADLEHAPRRLKVAKIFDWYEGAGNFAHGIRAQWVRPEDKRASR